MKILISLSTAKASPIAQLGRTISNMVRLNWSKRRAEYKDYPVSPWTGLHVSFNEWLDSKVGMWKIAEIASASLGVPAVLNLKVADYAVRELLNLGRYEAQDTDELKTLLLNFLAPVARAQGWYIPEIKTGRGGLSLFFRPLAYKPLEGLPQFLYHFSRLENRDKILRKGILPRKGQYGTDYMYPPRVHLLSKFDLGAIQDLSTAIFSHGSGQSIESQYYDGVDEAGLPIVVFKINRDRLPKGIQIYRDPSLPNGLWTYTHIPPNSIEVMYEDTPLELETA